MTSLMDCGSNGIHFGVLQACESLTQFIFSYVRLTNFIVFPFDRTMSFVKNAIEI